MSVFVLVTIALVAAAPALWFGAIDMDNHALFFAAIVASVALVGCGLVVLIVYSSRAVGRITCHNWSAQTGFRSKFVVLNWADTGTCLVLAPNGRWVKNTRVIVNVPSEP